METRTKALLLAADPQAHTGRPSCLFEIQGKPAIHWELDSFYAAGIRDVTVIVGSKSDELDAFLAARGVRSVRNPHFRLGEFSSIQVGIRSFDVKPDRLILLPADMPFLKSRTIRRMTETFGPEETPVVIPSILGIGGIPLRIDRPCMRDLLEVGPLENIRSVLAKRGRESRLVECPDNGLRVSLSAAADGLLSVENRIRFRELPDHDECLALLGMYRVPPEIVCRAEAAAEIAEAMARMLNDTEDAALNADLAAAASLLCNIVQDMPNHALMGAAIMRKEGFPALAGCVGSHSVFERPKDDNWKISEKEIVFIAEKLAQAADDAEWGTEIDKAIGDSGAARKARKRIEAIRRIKARVMRPQPAPASR